MKISEIFYSIQGESTFSGLPCIFIRFFGCNLLCDWCDTRYSFQEKFTELSLKDVMARISKYPCNLVEITGGEPLFQREELIELCSELQHRNYQILIETNGTILLNDIPDYCIKIVDVKTPSANTPINFILSNLRFLNPTNDQLKFVISDKNDFDFMEDFIQSNSKNLPRSILVSPNLTKINPELIAQWILESGKELRLQLQLQKYIWPNKKRGV